MKTTNLRQGIPVREAVRECFITYPGSIFQCVRLFPPLLCLYVSLNLCISMSHNTIFFLMGIIPCRQGFEGAVGPDQGPGAPMQFD